MYDSQFISNGDPSVCAKCGRKIGRAGRTDAEVIAALDSGEFLTAFGCTDYSTGPPWLTTYYCGTCRKEESHGP